MIKYTTALLAVLFTTAVSAAEITPYGTFNYKWSHDENTSGVANDKLGDNGSKIGISITEESLEGSSIGAFALLEVGVDTDDDASNTFDSRLAYVGVSTDLGSISAGRQSHPVSLSAPRLSARSTRMPPTHPARLHSAPSQLRTRIH